MYVLFLDDMQERHDLIEKYLGPHHCVLHAWNYDECIGILNAELQLGLIMFDRDLGDFVVENERKIERTGHTVIHYMRDHIPQEKFPPMAIVHSYNEQAKYMAEDLHKMGIATRQIMFSGDLVKQLVQELAAQ